MDPLRITPMTDGVAAKKKPPSLVGLGGSRNYVLRAYGLYFTVAQP